MHLVTDANGDTADQLRVHVDIGFDLAHLDADLAGLAAEGEA